MGLLDTLGLSSSSANRRLRTQRRQALKIGEKTTQQQIKPVEQGYAQAQTQLAPALTNIGDIYGQEQTGRNAYLDFLNLTPGGSERTLDRFNYSPMTMDLLKQQQESLLRDRTGGYLRSGGTGLELQRQAYMNLAPEWQNYGNRLQQFDPLGANQQLANIGTTLGGWNVGQGRDISNIYGTQGQNRLAASNDYFSGLNQNAANVAGNWGSLAQGLIGAAANFAGGGVGGVPGAGNLLGPAGFSRFTGSIGSNPNWNVS